MSAGHRLAPPLLCRRTDGGVVVRDTNGQALSYDDWSAQYSRAMTRGRPVKILPSPRPIHYARRCRGKLRTRRADALSHKKKAPSRVPLRAAELSPQLGLPAKRQGVGGWGAAQLNPARQYDTQRPIAHVLVITKNTNLMPHCLFVTTRLPR
jgi:hypothetical protein